MKIAKRFGLLGLLALIACLGCSHAYRSYSPCRVECHYCAPRPLPYTHYEGCVCHSCAVSKFHSQPASQEPSPEQSNEGDSGPE